MVRILHVGRSIIAALFAVSLMLIVMLVAAVLAVPALAAGTHADSEKAAASKKSAAASAVEQAATATVSAEIAPQPASTESAPAKSTGAKNLCVVHPINLLSPQQVEQLEKQSGNELEITQDFDLHVIILRGKHHVITAGLEALQKLINVRQAPVAADDPGDDSTVDDPPWVDVVHFKRIDPAKGIALVKQVLPHNKATFELREKAKALVIEGSRRNVNEALDLLKQVEGSRKNYLVYKFFDLSRETKSSKGTKASDHLRIPAGNDERQRERNE